MNFKHSTHLLTRWNLPAETALLVGKYVQQPSDSVLEQLAEAFQRVTDLMVSYQPHGSPTVSCV